MVSILCWPSSPELWACPGVQCMPDTLLTTKTPFEETNFTNKCQLQMASCLEVDLCSFSFSVLEFCLVWTCIGHMCCQGFYDFIYLLALLVWKMFPRNHPPPPGLMISQPFFLHKSLNLDKRDLIKTFHYGLSFPKSLTLCALSSCVSLWLLWWGLLRWYIDL